MTVDGFFKGYFDQLVNTTDMFSRTPVLLGSIFLPSVEQLSKLSTYGGNDSIVAFARNHGVNIVIHQLNEPRWVIYGGDFSKNGQARELHISYHNGEHYSSVRCFNDNTTEPAWVKHNEKTSAVTAVSKISG